MKRCALLHRRISARQLFDRHGHPAWEDRPPLEGGELLSGSHTQPSRDNCLYGITITKYIMSEMYQTQVTDLNLPPAPMLRSEHDVLQARITNTYLETLRSWRHMMPKMYAVILEKDEDGRFVASVPDLPGTISDGATEDDALVNIKDAILAMLESMGQESIYVDCHIVFRGEIS